MATHAVEVKLPAIPLVVPDAARRAVEALVESTLQLALTTAAGYLSDEAPVGVSGQLAQSFTASPATTEGGIELTGQTAVGDLTGRVFSALPYAVVIDEGRRPGFGVSRAGIASLRLWVQRKLGLSGDEADRATWAIAQTIKARGIPAQHFAARGISRARPTIEQMFAALSTQVAAALTQTGGTR